jgi:surfactin synthase thioesterase subunit
VRLLCLPYAGAGAVVFRTWSAALPADVELLPVQLPGRGVRLREPMGRDLGALADQIAGALDAYADLPLGIFGHSMGSWLGLAVARRLEDAGRAPFCLFASGRQAPSLGCTQSRLSHLEDEAFLDQIEARYAAVPPEIRRDREMLDLVLPALRADMTALEAYEHRGGPLSCPITAMAGASDRNVPVEHLAPWAAETLGAFRVQTFPGGHFYFNEDPRPLLGALAEGLGSARARAGGVAR